MWYREVEVEACFEFIAVSDAIVFTEGLVQFYVSLAVAFFSMFTLRKVMEALMQLAAGRTEAHAGTVALADSSYAYRW
jgi:hypothetical protein